MCGRVRGAREVRMASESVEARLARLEEGLARVEDHLSRLEARTRDLMQQVASREGYLGTGVDRRYL
jgi:hypothetical protein